MVTISPQYGPLIKIQPSVASWKTPSFAMIHGTTIGQKYYAQFYPMPPAPGWNRVLMQDQFDSVLYLSAKPADDDADAQEPLPLTPPST